MSNVNTSTPLYETFKFFRNTLQFAGSMSYDQWINLPSDHKAAALYLQFYDQISLAWYKSKSFYADEEEAVETMMQYLVKNVPLLEADPKKFSPKYIYRVAYNCLYCISHDRKCDKDRWELECSNLVLSEDGSYIDLFDTVADMERIDGQISRSKMWDLINNMSLDTKLVVQKLLGGSETTAWLDTEDADKVGDEKAIRKAKPKDLYTVDPEKEQFILKQLAVILAPYLDLVG